MSDENQLTVKSFFNKESVQKKFQELLGEKSAPFITSVMQVVNGNNLLKKATPESIYNAAAMGAVLDLPINNNLGYAWIVPYGNQAQFQMAAKGYVQLAHRTGKYQSIKSVIIYSGQFVSWNPITEELVCDFSKPETGDVAGYYAFFNLNNGFKKADFWSKEKMQGHGKRYSKSFSNGPWKDEFDKMGKKTVLKHLLKDWGILSLEMEKAIVADQAVINNVDTMDVEYVDAGSESPIIQKPVFTEDEFEIAKDSEATIEQIREAYETDADTEQAYMKYCKK